MNRQFVNSSNLNSVGYDDGVLEIAFHHGGTYQYFNVPSFIYSGLLSASSKGTYFHENIKNNYQHSRIN